MLNATHKNGIYEYTINLFETKHSEPLKPKYISSSSLHAAFSQYQGFAETIAEQIKQSLFLEGIELATIAKKIDKLTPSRLVNMADIMSFLKKYQAIQQSPNLLQLEEYLTNKKKAIIYDEGIRVKNTTKKEERYNQKTNPGNQISKMHRNKERYNPGLCCNNVSWYWVTIDHKTVLASSPSKLDPRNILGKGCFTTTKPLQPHAQSSSPNNTKKHTPQYVIKIRRMYNPDEDERKQEKQSSDIIRAYPEIFLTPFIKKWDSRTQKQYVLEQRVVPLIEIFSCAHPYDTLTSQRQHFTAKFMASYQNHQQLRIHTSFCIVSLFIKCMQNNIFICDANLGNFGLTSDGAVISYDTPPMQVNLQDQLPERTWIKTPCYLNPVLEEKGYTYAAEMLSQLLTLLWYGTGYKSLNLTPFTLLSKMLKLTIKNTPSLRVYLDQNQQEKSDHEGILGIKMFMHLIFDIQEFADLIKAKLNITHLANLTKTETSINDLHGSTHEEQCNNYVASFDVYRIINTIVTGIDSSKILSCMQKMQSHLAKQLRQITQNSQDNREQEPQLEPQQNRKQASQSEPQQRSSDDLFKNNKNVKPQQQRRSHNFFEDEPPKQSILGFCSCFLNYCKQKRPEPRQEYEYRSQSRYTSFSQ